MSSFIVSPPAMVLFAGVFYGRWRCAPRRAVYFGHSQAGTSLFVSGDAVGTFPGNTGNFYQAAASRFCRPPLHAVHAACARGAPAPPLVIFLYQTGNVPKPENVTAKNSRNKKYANHCRL
ncbi:unnamed protein product, partial [Phaeothamnion confervicola]